MIKKAALAILSAQEGNYAAWPKGITGRFNDVRFGVAHDLLETIRYYGILKMTIFNMQWMAMSSLTGSGSYAALGDSSSLAILGINAIMEGFADQFDRQIGRRLFTWNADRFPGMVHRPRFRVSPVEKEVSLLELGQFLKSIQGVIPLTIDDYKAVRKITRFLPETDQTEEATLPEKQGAKADQTNPQTGTAPEPTPTAQQVEQAMFGMMEAAQSRDPELYAILVEGHNGHKQ
jgi:hypothetical protein